MYRGHIETSQPGEIINVADLRAKLYAPIYAIFPAAVSDRDLLSKTQSAWQNTGYAIGASTLSHLSQVQRNAAIYLDQPDGIQANVASFLQRLGPIDRSHLLKLFTGNELALQAERIIYAKLQKETKEGIIVNLHTSDGDEIEMPYGLKELLISEGTVFKRAVVVDGKPFYAPKDLKGGKAEVVLALGEILETHKDKLGSILFPNRLKAATFLSNLAAGKGFYNINANLAVIGIDASLHISPMIFPDDPSTHFTQYTYDQMIEAELWGDFFPNLFNALVHEIRHASQENLPGLLSELDAIYTSMFVTETIVKSIDDDKRWVGLKRLTSQLWSQSLIPVLKMIKSEKLESSLQADHNIGEVAKANNRKMDFYRSYFSNY
ncbi:hypothetical protein HY029_05950 [Candidatus Gottesmanbacteria bacterium]|nr:hypothetical protein [Candidatus Gottesmanbacteria bacterium]